jgi:drug/metabolite transporter (DMT)-like permease
MMFLLGSIVLSSYLTLSFKVLQRYNIPVFPAIVCNYITCVITGSLFSCSFPVNGQAVQSGWFVWALVLGALFISLFNVIAYTTQNIGVAVASVANKLSLVIPAAFFIAYNNESLGILKIAGMALAVLAVIFTCYTPAGGQHRVSRMLLVALPVILFIGSGALDTIYKFVEQRWLNENSLNAFLITAFAAAAVMGLVILLAQIVRSKKPFDYRAIAAGVAIGIPNYFSIWCLGKVYKQNWMESSAIIPVNNMGIVLFSTVMAWLLFKEKLSGINWLGIILSLAAIALIAFSGQLS